MKPAHKPDSALHETPRILIVRRDNIGDLILTTPLITALRSRYPQAWIGVYTNDYASEVLHGNPALDRVFIYRKLKHLQSHGWQRAVETVLTLWQRFRMRCQLRAMQLDWVLLATPREQARTLALGRSFKPRHIAGFTSAPASAGLNKAIDLTMLNQLPESARVLQLLTALDPASALPADAEQQWPVRIFARTQEIEAVCQNHPTLTQRPASERIARIAVHISARKPSQRWPIESFAELIEQLIEQGNQVVLLWAPGSSSNPLHPGDDEKAAAILHSLSAGAIGALITVPTTSLGCLIATLSLCDAMICSDGGAMHIAAGLGKPIVCMFGKSEAHRWRPWGVPYRLLQPASQEVRDISVAEVLRASEELVSH
jgi:ADP-heptose:LPS heptosyltransferase